MAESDAPRVTLWSALVVRGPLEKALLGEFSAQVGVEVDAVFDPTTVLMERLRHDGAPDVLISTTGSLQQLQSDDDPTVEHIVPLVRSAIGVGVKAGGVLPPLSSTDELVRLLVDARSVAYSRMGQSGIFFVEMLERLGIASIVSPKATVIEKGFTGEAVMDGRADVAIQQLSELAFVDGIAIVGPLPDDVQHYTDFSVGLGRDRRGPSAAALSDFLTAPHARDVFQSYGLLPASS
jgi:molybdate transport system substrate-binding protein